MTGTDEDMVEQVLMKNLDRSEALLLDNSSSAAVLKESSTTAMTEAIASLKNTLNIDSLPGTQSVKMDSCRKIVWGGVLRNLTQLYPGSQLPEKLVSNICKHYDSLPLSYAQAGLDMKYVFLHIRMIDQSSVDEHPSIMIQDVSSNDVHGSVFKLTFACNSAISWPSMSGALDSASICCKKIQIFEKKGFTLGVVLVLVQAGQDKMFKTCVENALKSSMKKSKLSTVKLPYGFCGCQEENTVGGDVAEIEEENDDHSSIGGNENSTPAQLTMPLSDSSFVVSVDEWQTVQV